MGLKKVRTKGIKRIISRILFPGNKINTFFIDVQVVILESVDIDKDKTTIFLDREILLN